MVMESITISRQPKNGQNAVALFVQVANRFDSQILVQTGTKTINAKSIMGVMTLDFEKGSQMNVTATGDDEQEAIQGIRELLCKN